MVTRLNKPDISVSKLLSKHLAILGGAGTLGLGTTVKVNKSLHSGGLELVKALISGEYGTKRVSMEQKG